MVVLTKDDKIRYRPALCQRRVPVHLRDEIRLELSVRGNAITIVERRPPWRADFGPEWSSMKIAQLRFDAGTQTWTLWWGDRNGRWDRYWDVDAAPDIDELLRQTDPRGPGLIIAVVPPRYGAPVHPRRLLRRLTRGSVKNVTFGEMRRLVEAFGFELKRVHDSHYIFVHPDVPELVNLQEVGRRGQALSNPAVPQDRRAVRFDPGGRGVRDYHINVFYSEEDGGYIADVPDLEACSAFGKTPEEAVAAVSEARDVWLATAREEGRPIPRPRYRPAIYPG